MGSSVILMLSSFSTVFLLVFQQQNVQHKKYLWAALTSIGITLSQVLVFRGVVAASTPMEIAALVVGGVGGVQLSMLIHAPLVGWFNRHAREEQPEGHRRESEDEYPIGIREEIRSGKAAVPASNIVNIARAQQARRVARGTDDDWAGGRS